MKHYIVTCHFKMPREAIGEDLIRQHLALLQKGYEEGYILFYGPMEPEVGTVAIARVDAAGLLGTTLVDDPLLARGMISVHFSEFVPIRFPPSLGGWVDPLGFHRQAKPDPDEYAGHQP